MKTRYIAGFVIATVALTLAAPAAAQKYDFKIQNDAVGSEPVAQPHPAYPSKLRRGQEGWVRVNYVITADGKAAHPIIVDSVGGAVFERAVIERMPDWRFEPPGEDLVNNTTSIRFEMYRGRDRATSGFMRSSKSVMEDLLGENLEDARSNIDTVFQRGGWNLYESTMLWLIDGRLAGAEGDTAGKLESYRRALGVANRNALDDKGLRDLLQNLFELEMQLGQFSAADRTLARLRAVPDSHAVLDELAASVAQLEETMASRERLAASARLYTPGNADGVKSLWTYVPQHRTFSFAALSGNVERFEVRCERDRLEGPVEAGRAWSLPQGASDCQVFVFGEQGATFEFVEHNESESVDVAAGQTVARSDVLD